MAKELVKQYDPKQVEDRIYRFWLDGGYFHAKPNPEKEPYTIVIPPPNITGQLHMGHAMDNTMQDILIRWRRMQGYEALWMPGTDHASIATEAKIVEAMKAEGITKEEIGRDAFLARAWAWKEEYGGRIVSQLKKLGSSCDWARERFTLDDGCNKAVTEVFNRLYEKGLIYRGERIINWCPHCLTSISDAEVEYAEQDGHFWHIRYPLTDGSGTMEIATTRPETLLGDTAVAVHPDDPRYQHLIGKTLLLPLVNREIPIVADHYVEMEFGTGIVKITPAHDPNDFEVGLRHNLPILNVMNPDASINENGGKYAGLSREQARKAVVADLEAGGFLAEIKEHKHNVGTCYRCSATVEPRVSKQWFVQMEPLAAPARDAVRTGKTKFVPERFDKIYFNWMENIKDWCISRQLWWGHRIPAWYCKDCGEITVSREKNLQACSHCGSAHIHQDEDTLDTWFSSALWPFSTLGWPDDTPELRYFYPTDVLVTSYDIIFFWVARMIFSGIEQMEQTPFHTVFIHGLVRDAQGRKMSKSLGNGIDPLEAIDAFGADALRFTLTYGTSPGNDTRFSEDKVKANRNFCNKMWNAVRYVLMNLEEGVEGVLPETLTIEDQWVLSKLNRLTGEVTENMEHYDLGVAAGKLYDFLWDVVCDWYIELTKSRIQQGGSSARGAQQVLLYVIEHTLRLLHPFMPFITEELWQAIPHRGESLMIMPWPQYSPALDFSVEESAFSKVMDAIKAVRTRRAEMNVPPSKKAKLFIETESAAVFAQGVPFLQRLAYANEVEISSQFAIEGAVQIVTDSARILIPMTDLVDMQQERARLEKEFAHAQKEIDLLSKKLSNEAFVAKAPAQVVQAEQEKLAKAQRLLEKTRESLAAID